MNCTNTPQCKEPCGDCTQQWPVPAGSEVDRERAAFEEWVKKTRGSPWPIALDRADAGNYLYLPAVEAWQVWQARAALQSQQPAVTELAGKWEGAEEWMPLAWELCANENGEEACTELIWEGGPVPEPWGDRWLKYEDQAKEMIAMVRKHVPAPGSAAPALVLNEARAALAASAQQVEGEAVAWVDERAIDWLAGRSASAFITTRLQASKSFERRMPLYTHPTPPTSAAGMAGMVQQARLGMVDGLNMALSVVELHGMGGDVIAERIKEIASRIKHKAETLRESTGAETDEEGLCVQIMADADRLLAAAPTQPAPEGQR